MATNIDIKLLSKSENIKWPRYELKLESGLSWKESTEKTIRALRTQDHQTVMLSQFKYDPETGIVDTRVQRDPR